MDICDSLQGAYPFSDHCQFSVTSSPVHLPNPPHGHVKSGRPPHSALPRYRLPGRGVYPPLSRPHRAHSSLQERGPVLACLGLGREAIRGGAQKRRRRADPSHPRGREHRLLGAPRLSHVAHVPPYSFSQSLAVFCGCFPLLPKTHLANSCAPCSLFVMMGSLGVLAMATCHPQLIIYRVPTFLGAVTHLIFKLLFLYPYRG